MMQVYTSKGVAYVTIGDSLYNFPGDKGLLENDELINILSSQEIGELLKMFGGLPFNFMDYLVKKVKLVFARLYFAVCIPHSVNHTGLLHPYFIILS